MLTRRQIFAWAGGAIAAAASIPALAKTQITAFKPTVAPVVADYGPYGPSALDRAISNAMAGVRTAPTGRNLVAEFDHAVRREMRKYGFRPLSHIYTWNDGYSRTYAGPGAHSWTHNPDDTVTVEVRDLDLVVNSSFQAMTNLAECCVRAAVAEQAEKGLV